jgi:citrate lyase subunit beta/citryl-CoA lyase
VPGDRPDRFSKALASGAQLVILDLEDAVAPERKAAARDTVAEWLARHGGVPAAVEVRVNAGDGDDLAALAHVHGTGAEFGVRLPKTEGVAELDAVAERLAGVPVTALVETARGVEALLEIGAHPCVTALNLGEADLASDLGSRAGTVLDYARVKLLYAARANGLPAPMMSVYPAIADLDGLRRDTELGRERGFVGRTAIHPSQIPVIRQAFAPPAEEVAWAEEVLAAMTAGGVARLTNGEMADPAMVGRAQAILALVAATR